MTLWSTNYRGYTIHGKAGKSEVTYQSHNWPRDPRIVKAPSLNAAKGRINEELRRINQHGLHNVVYLAKAPEETDVNRIAIAEAGVRRCFARRHEGRYAFMPYEDAVRHCRKWIAALRDMRMEK